MAQRVVLHVGSMKSGTSFLQNVLGENRDRLRDQGVLFAGPRWKAQVAAVRDLIAHGGPGQEPMAADGPWRTLAAEVVAWPGTAVISMEFLGPRSVEQIERIAASFDGAPVQAVVSARDLARTIPAMWLESTQNGSTVGWADYLAAVRRDRGGDPAAARAARNFWRQQAIPAMVRRWQDSLGPGSTTLLTVPRPGAPAPLLWERFAGVLEVDPAGCELAVRANPSIGLATAQMLLRLNRAMQRPDGSVPANYDRYVKHILAKRGLVARQKQEPKLGLDLPWVLRRGEVQIRKLSELATAGVRVVGDLAELRPEPVAGVHADDVPLEAQLDAAVDGLAHLVDQWSESVRSERRAQRRAARQASRQAAGQAAGRAAQSSGRAGS